MKIYPIVLFLLLTTSSYATVLTVLTLTNDTVSVRLYDSAETALRILELKGRSDHLLRKAWTARTYKLDDGKLLIEFYDGSSAVIKNELEFDKLKNVRFVKNYSDRLKNNVSYKIELDERKAIELIKLPQTQHLGKYTPDIPEHLDFKVYQLRNGQILYTESAQNSTYATVYENIKTLASERDEIAAQLYDYEDDEYFMKELANGNPFLDYEPNEHLVYPEYVDAILSSHQLEFREAQVFVSIFWGNLYESKNGYWVLIDEIDQPNGAGANMPILTLRIYESIDAVRAAQARYEEFKESGSHGEHFYQSISDRYGPHFPDKVDSLINQLPAVLNFDREQLRLDDQGMKIVDEAIRWNHANWESFDSWYPAVLAYYGAYYIKQKNEGVWDVQFDQLEQVWIPQVTLENGSAAFDVLDFYESLMEWPIPLRVAGDFDGSIKRMRQKFRNGN